MALEIERKFLVIGDAWRIGKGQYLCQGYLSRDKNRTVRVRIADDHAYLTTKGISTGATRPEFEYEIPLTDARQLLDLCDKPLIEKVRREIEHEGFTWEVDEFHGENQGLILAEIELESEDQEFPHPDWLGQEVTDDTRYYNANLAVAPYSKWT